MWGSTEAILRIVNKVFREHHVDVPLSMLKVDFSNDFNFVDRSVILY